MTEESKTQEPLESEIDTLKKRAAQMGITHHPSIGVDKLREKIDEALKDKPPTPEQAQASLDAAAVAVPADQTARQQRKRSVQEANELIRVRVTCMNSNKKEWDGEIFTTGNAEIPTIKKYVPFGVEWHVPRMIVTMIEQRECQTFYNAVDKRSGTKYRKGRLQKEFAVEYLEALTPQELRDLAQRQAMAGGTAEAA